MLLQLLLIILFTEKTGPGFFFLTEPLYLFHWYQQVTSRRGQAAGPGVVVVPFDEAGKQVMYRSPPLRQERKIVEDTTDHDAHAKDHEARNIECFWGSLSLAGGGISLKTC